MYGNSLNTSASLKLYLNTREKSFFDSMLKKEGGVSNLSIKPKNELVLWKAPPSEEDNVNKNICENELRYLLCIQDEGRMR